MKIEALNCPNCGAAVPDESNSCGHCGSRLKTMSCSSCFQTIFEGANFCPLCGSAAVNPGSVRSVEKADCPRCKRPLDTLEVSGVEIRECPRCDGVWTDVANFEAICRDREKQAAVLSKLDEISHHRKPAEIRYVPCPRCGELMNRSNFARISGVIVDICKNDGVWFDADELPKIIEFITKGGLDHAREKEKARLEDERNKIREEKFKLAVDRFKSESSHSVRRTGSLAAIRNIIDVLLD